MCLILLYNDLSICYAGLDNSSMSRGYAEEARKIIEKEERYLFGWDKIPGDDNVRLITFLKANYGITGVNTAEIEKIDDDKTINVSTNEKSLSLKLNDEKTKVNLLINDRGVNEFTVKIENGKLNLYEKSYKEFEKKWSASKSKNLKDIEDHNFVSSKLYDLYTVALFNQALAERRSSLYTEAERNFKKIIKYAERKTKDKKNTPLLNFNYYSAILNLSDLYMDLGRGREALELLKKVINEENLEKENDMRYWNAYIAKINALIDQSKYDDAEEILTKKFCEKGNNCTLVKRHRVTSTGFKALNCYARCKIEKVRNTLNIDDKNEDGELKKAETVINGNIKIIIKRKQKGLETKAYKQLSDIYKILSQDEEDKDISDEYDMKVIKYLTMFISEAEPKIDRDDFISHQKRDYWIDKCDDLNALESFTDQIIKVTTDEPIDKYRDLLEKLKEKIIKECEDKDQLSRAERSVTKIEKALGDKKGIKYKKDTFDKIFRSKDNLTKKEIITRLDTNEKEFVAALFKRSEMNKPEHIAEVIVLRRWNSFSPGLYRESIGSLGGGYLLRIKKNSYLFSFSGIVKEKGRQELLNRLRALDHSDLAEIMEGAKYREEDKKIRITKNNERVATLKIEKDLCYLEWLDHELEIGVVKKEDDKLNIYSEDSDVENIVIDPGYNFLQNFRSEGFHVEDIDTIIVTHSHLDHCAELLPIMDLIYQINKRYEDYNLTFRVL